MEINPEFKKVVIQIAKEAGDRLMNSFHRVKVVKFKDRQDVCTNLDLEIEKLLIDKIRSNYPGHNIISEERGEENLGSEFTWVLDPLDGSKHYLRKLPIFCVSIALLKKEKIIFGLVFSPATNSLFYAARNQGAFLNDNKIHVSQEKDIANSFIYAELPNYKSSERVFNKHHQQLRKIFRKSYRVRAYGSGPLGLCYVATGGFEAYVTLHGDAVKLYDIAAGILIVEEAGGRVTDIKGHELTSKTIGSKTICIVASNGKIHNQLLKLIK